MSENPFICLHLPPTADVAEVVRQGARLSQRASDEAARDRIRQAVQRLAQNSDAHTLWGLLSHPFPEYACPELDRFVAAHRRPPKGQEELPGVDLVELQRLLLHVLTRHRPGGETILEHLPIAETAEAIERQTADPLWQSLLGTPNA